MRVGDMHTECLDESCLRTKSCSVTGRPAWPQDDNVHATGASYGQSIHARTMTTRRLPLTPLARVPEQWLCSCCKGIHWPGHPCQNDDYVHVPSESIGQYIREYVRANSVFMRQPPLFGFSAMKDYILRNPYALNVKNPYSSVPSTLPPRVSQGICWARSSWLVVTNVH